MSTREQLIQEDAALAVDEWLEAVASRWEEGCHSQISACLPTHLPFRVMFHLRASSKRSVQERS